MCTFTHTGDNGKNQLLYVCNDCYGKYDAPVFCENCLKCHKGHKYFSLEEQFGFCSCYNSGQCKSKYIGPNPKCTYSGKPIYVNQVWARCFDCFPENQGACLGCIENCHKGHKIGKLQKGNFFCDCGAEGKCYDHVIVANNTNLPAKYKSREITSPFNTFTEKLSNATDKISIISPVSIGLLLGLIQNGANGNTCSQFNNLFGCRISLPVIYSTQIVLSKEVKIANVIFLNQRNQGNIKQQYLDDIKDCALVKSLNFENSDYVSKEGNNFIASNTNNKITNLIKPDRIDPNSHVILINTLYFDARWNKEFTASDKSEVFDNDDKLMLTMLYGYGMNAYYAENDDAQFIELQFKNFDYVFGIILPKIDQSVARKYLNNPPSLILNNGFVKIPKFTQRQNIVLNDIVKSLGITDIFDQSKCDLSNMIDSKTVIGNIITEAFIEVTEIGVKAGAATITDVERGGRRPEFVFEATRPFTYYIRYKPLNIKLFIGIFKGVSN